jgi:arginyl-tRNA synthetase
VDKLSSDSIRFMMMTRKNEAPLDFDIQKVVEQSKDNLIFYIQYAYARGASIKRRIFVLFPDLDLSSLALCKSDFAYLNDNELSLIKLLSQWPNEILYALKTGEICRLSFYLNSIASLFHELWSQGRSNTELRFIYPDNIELTKTKFSVVQAMMNVISSGLSIFGISTSEHM